ncbi:hypothetical protein DFS34DRAFT_644173 [Phlyctochytrium arcticum]|nr:hypothetical protein DFS34DRAFT_644173 [Phlyctochytrium arcticum]
MSRTTECTCFCGRLPVETLVEILGFLRQAVDLTTLVVASDCVRMKAIVASNWDRLTCTLADSASSGTLNQWYRTCHASALAQGLLEPDQIRAFISQQLPDLLSSYRKKRIVALFTAAGLSVHMEVPPAVVRAVPDRELGLLRQLQERDAQVQQLTERMARLEYENYQLRKELNAIRPLRALFSSMARSQSQSCFGDLPPRTRTRTEGSFRPVAVWRQQVQTLGVL